MVMAMEVFARLSCQVIGGRNMELRAVDHFGRIHEPIRLVQEKMRGLKIMTIITMEADIFITSLIN